MIIPESLVFALALVDTGAILFLLIYYIITLSDLECDYLNAQECCEKLNYWQLPKSLAHCFITLLMLIHGDVKLFVVSLPLLIWLTFEFFTVPRGNLGKYDPAEIHNRGQLRSHLRDILLHIGHYLLFFFIFLYYFILGLLRGNPISRSDEIISDL